MLGPQDEDYLYISCVEKEGQSGIKRASRSRSSTFHGSRSILNGWRSEVRDLTASLLETGRPDQ